MRQVVILAGGEGSRLRKISNGLPKPMTNILGKPLLHYLIEQSVKYGMLDVKLLVSYKQEVIREYFADGSKYGANIQYISEDVPRGTAGALIDALPQLDNQFMVIYGDTFLNIDLESMWKFHQSQSCDVSIFLHPNDHPYDSDLVEIDSNLRVKKIHNYPHEKGWRQNLVNAAVYVFNKESLKNVFLDKVKSDIAKDLFPLMLDLNKDICGYLSTEYIKDMGTPERLAKLELDINSGRVRALEKQALKSAIFLDRDGTINKEVGHLSSIDQFELIDGVGEAIKRINASGILVVVATNQPVVARGEVSDLLLRKIHNKMETLLGSYGAYIDRLYYCPHHPDNGFEGEIEALKVDCDCRKPKNGMFLQAKKDLNIDLEASWVVGDSFRDIDAAKNTGIRSVLVQTGHAGRDGNNDISPNFFAKDLSEAVDMILKEIKK